MWIAIAVSSDVFIALMYRTHGSSKIISSDLLVIAAFQVAFFAGLISVGIRLVRIGLPDTRRVHMEGSPETPLITEHANQDSLEKLNHQQKWRARVLMRKNILLYSTFMVQSICSIYISVKAVSLSSDHIGDIVMLVFSAIMPFASFYCFEGVMESVNSDFGVVLPHLHMHPMQFYSKGTNRLKKSKCDACRTRGARIDCYTCADCNYTICLLCMRKPKAPGAAQNSSTSTYLWRILSFTFAHKLILFVALGCLLFSAISGLMLPHFQGHTLDTVVKYDRDAFLVNIKWFGIFSAVSAVFGAIKNLCLLYIKRYVIVDVRNFLFEKLIHQDITFFHRMQSGQLTARLTNDVNTMLVPVSTLLNTIVSNTINLAGGLLMCFYTSWRLTVLCVTIIGPVIYVTRSYALWSKGINREIQTAFGDANSVATEAFGNIQTIKTFSTEKLETRNYASHNSYALKKSLQDALGSAGTNMVTSFIQLGATFVLLFYGGTVVLDQKDEPNPTLSVGNLITFQLYWNMLTNGITSLSDDVGSVTQSAGAAQRVLGLVDNMPVVNPDAGIILKTVKGDIDFNAVTFAYESDPSSIILDDLSLEVKSGQICSLVGVSGCGKSTTLSLLIKLFEPNRGCITIDGRSLWTVNTASYHKFMGVVLQDTQLFARSILENIAYGMDTSEYTYDDVIHASKQAFAHQFISEFSDGYDTLVGERGIRMSGGQRQRIAIARAFLRKPKLLLLDEATSALDSEAEELVQQALDNLIKAGLSTIILVTHRLSSFMYSDVIAVIKNGKVVEKGTHQELLDLEGEYKKLISRQLHRQSS